jgi:uncharacterized protein (TIRG00374 family)
LFKEAYAGQDLSKVWQDIRNVNLFWVGMVALASIACHTVRTLRWQLLLRASGKEVDFIKLFASLMAAYFVNQALPRVGELLRPYLLNRSDKISYGTTLGSVIAERLIDTFCLLVLLAFCFFFLHHISYQFFEAHIHAPLQGSLGKMPYWKIGAIVMGIGMLLYLVMERMHKKEQAKLTEESPVNKIDEFANESLSGITAVLKVEKKFLFLCYTAFIWSMYFLMTYLWFFSMKETSHLGLKAALFVWAIGNIGRMVPVQGGGAGAYHYLVIQAFLIFGVSASVAGAMALMIHGLQTFIYVVLGSVGLVAYMLLTAKEKIQEPNE